jgi:glycosyltransferase involved in cell wall biosynthesis
MNSAQAEPDRRRLGTMRRVELPRGDRNEGARPVISVVVPVYGCRSCLEHLHERLTATLSDLVSSHEIILVDDRASDGSWPEIERLVEFDPNVRGVRLSRNFGQHAAITAGLSRARGEWTVVMDCDLQDPPEDIPRLFAKALEGHDIVFGRRSHKPTTAVRRALAALYFRCLRTFTQTHIDGQYGTFSVISRKVVAAFLELHDQDRHYLMILSWLGFDAVAVDYEPARRYRGKSSYRLPRLIEHAFDGAFFQTTVLLRWIVYFGFLLALVGAMLAAYLLAARIAGHAYPGWTSIVVLTLVLCGFIILSTGITGLYIGKVFEQARDRPIFVVDQIAEHSGAGDADSAVAADERADLSSVRH